MKVPMVARVSGLIASIASFCIAVVLLCGGVATADPAAPTMGTIHVRKYGGAEWEKNPTGVEGQVLPDGAKPLEGITYSLTRVKAAPGITDVATAAVTTTNFDELKKLTAAKVEAAFTDRQPGWEFETFPDAVTNDAGAADWVDIPVGVYLLQEKQSPNSTSSYHPSTLVFLPTPDPATIPKNTGWLTDENGQYVTWVYPKDSLEDNIKTVVDNGVKIGGQVTYTVSLTIPAVRALSDGEKTSLNAGREYDLSDFGLWDNLDKSLTFDQRDKNNTVTVRYGTSPDGLATLDSADFDVDVFDDRFDQPADDSAPHSGQKLAVALTSSGLNKVARAKIENDAKETPDKIRVFVTFTPTLTHAGIVPNKAKVYKTRGVAKGLVDGRDPGTPLPDNPPSGLDTFETNTVVSAWRAVNVTKTDVEAKPLSDAEFTVFSKDAELAKGETDNKGKLGLVVQASDLRDGAPSNSAQYELVETKAPRGYELLAEPVPMEACENKAEDGTCQNVVPITFDAAKYTGDDKWTINDDGVVTPKSTETELVKAKQDWFDGQDLLPVANVAVNFSLPRTGGFGVGIFLLLGGALIVGAWLTRKRKA